ncbi:MAG: hypothetical protein TR69_WS6001001271 [candidate division WS6 bacterium OLB20]|uniref:UPF0102 protein TR69_WS6001001271 n=1 Tax=candidate division WS6 bacterium OLB20 TaxID=1617426 RepID=A0A136LWF0_9BACT|nr:MAG: hypothetical protein TR69_WS6001001271 [candidate division WS6 bacterium OLB20]
MGVTSRTKGNRAEHAAAGYLRSRGFEIVGRNYTIRGGEIDIIARDGEQVVFFEVKSSSGAMSAVEMVSERKRAVLIRTCRYWLQKHNASDADWRIDFVGVEMQKGRIERLVHLENAIF